MTQDQWYHMGSQKGTKLKATTIAFSYPQFNRWCRNEPTCDIGLKTLFVLNSYKQTSHLSLVISGISNHFCNKHTFWNYKCSFSMHIKKRFIAMKYFLLRILYSMSNPISDNQNFEIWLLIGFWYYWLLILYYIFILVHKWSIWMVVICHVFYCILCCICIFYHVLCQKWQNKSVKSLS